MWCLSLNPRVKNEKKTSIQGGCSFFSGRNKMEKQKYYPWHFVETRKTGPPQKYNICVISCEASKSIDLKGMAKRGPWFGPGL